MMKKINIALFTVLGLCSCANGFDKAEGQVIYHWERENTGVKKFSRDHSECLRLAQDWHILPDMSSWFVTQEAQYNIRVDWHAEKGIWASYVPYPGSQPLMVNSIFDTEDVSPKKYRMCMENKGYWHRRYDIPETTNLFVYKPQQPNQNDPLRSFYY